MKEALFDALPSVNNYLATKSFVLPSNLISDSISIASPTLKFHNGFMELGLTPVFSSKAEDVTPWVSPVYDYSQYSEELRVDEDG